MRSRRARQRESAWIVFYTVALSGLLFLGLSFCR
jgi:hypothetical protein